MATNEIDKLEINVKVSGLSQASIRNVNALSDALERLNGVVSNLDGLKNYANAISQISDAVRTLQHTSVSKALGGGNKLRKEDFAEKGGRGVLPSIATGGQQINKFYLDRINAVTGVNRAYKSAEESAEFMNKALTEQEFAVSKSTGTWGRFLKAIGRIALYRTIRRALQLVTQGLATGLENIRTTNAELDISMKKLSQSNTALKNSFASLIAPLIQNVEPIFTRITDSMAKLVNRFEEAKSAMNGNSTYTRILTSDTKEYQEALKKVNGELLSFDRFESLNKKGGYTGVISDTVTMSAEEGKGIYNQLKLIETAILGIASAIAIISAVNIISKIADITNKMKLLTEGTKSAENATKALSMSTKALGVIGIASLATGILTLIANWKDMGATAKWLVPTLALLAGVIATVVALIAMGTGQWVKALSIGAIATGIGLTVGSTLATMKFADGGMVEPGTHFIAGEAGAEVVATSSRGTGVTNVEQFTDAMYNALAMYGVARGSDVNIRGDVVMNERTVGQIVTPSVYEEGTRVGYFRKV